ncbi:MAG: hypothetical protein ABEJ30_02620 [Halorientalis sp.]
MANDDSNPISRVFDLQRDAIERSQEAMHRGLEFQQRLNETLIENLDSGSEVRERSTEMTRDAVHNTLDVVERMVPSDEVDLDQVRESIDEQFDAAEEATADASERAQEVTESSLQEAEDAAESYVNSLDDQLDTLIEANRDLEEQTVEFLDRTEEQLEELQAEAETPLEGVEELRDRIEEMRANLTGRSE